MTDINFKLSGGVIGGLTTEQKRATGVQVFNQGIGLNDRVVEGVPLEGTGEIFNEDTMASGSFMTFMPDGWQEGLFYTRGAVVTNGLWTMVANTLTLDDPYPSPAGDPTRTIPAFAPTTESDSSVVYSGMTWILTESVVLKSLRIWVTELSATTHYRIIIIRTFAGQAPTTTIIDDPLLVENEFVVVAVLNQLAIAGTTFTILIDALNSGADQEVTGGWTFTGQDNIAPPVQAAWNHNNANTVVRIDKTDLDATDRTAELLGIIINSTILFADTDNPSAFNQYRTTGAPVDSGTYITYAVILQGQGEGGTPIGVTTMTATIPIPLPTEYAQELAGLANPAWATVIPALQFDGVDQSPLADTAFGVDLEADITTFSEDWNVLSFAG